MSIPGFAWHVFAAFPCNSCAVRVGVFDDPDEAERFSCTFAERNQVPTYRVLRPKVTP